MSDLLLTFSLEGITPRQDTPGERTLAGDPRFTIWNLERAVDGKLVSGVWEATPGKWRVDYEGKWEFCTITAGALTITEDGGEPITYKQGDSFVVRPGFKGVWEATETTRKLYVVYR